MTTVSTVPAAWAPVIAVRVVVLPGGRVTEVAATPPIVTVGLTKFVPWIVTSVPPAVDPTPGEIDVTVGGPRFQMASTPARSSLMCAAVITVVPATTRASVYTGGVRRATA